MKKLATITLCALWFVSCGHYVLVPPAIDLSPLERVGLISFAVEEAEGQLGAMATQQFLQDILYSQAGVRIIEIGDLDDVLSEIDKTKLDPEASASIGENFGVTAYFYGSIEISEVKPKIDISGVLQGGRIQAVFDMNVTARLLDTETGATLWTDSVAREGNLAYMSMTRGGVPYFDIRDQDDETRRLIEDMMHDLTRDFRPSRRRM